MNESASVHLKGGLKQESHRIWLRSDGALVAELYDFSDDSERCFGNDTAWGVVVARETLPQLVNALRTEAMFHDRIGGATAEDQLSQLLPLFRCRFDSFYDFKSWLDQQENAFSTYSDLFA